MNYYNNPDYQPYKLEENFNGNYPAERGNRLS